eukprot:12790008-Heterocapsa_arctica.AAC.1
MRQGQARSFLPMREKPARQETIVGATVLEEPDEAGLRIDGADSLDRAQLTPSDRLRDVRRKVEEGSYHDERRAL